MGQKIKYRKCTYKDYILANRIDEAKMFLLDRIPEGTLIYKYFRGLNRDLQSFENNTIWMGNAAHMNDPYDCSFLVNRRSKFKYSEDNRELATKEYSVQMEQDELSFKRQSSVFLTSFSERSTSLAMWGYYAANHMGVCVGYDLRKMIKELNLEEFQLWIMKSKK